MKFVHSFDTLKTLSIWEFWIRCMRSMPATFSRLMILSPEFFFKEILRVLAMVFWVDEYLYEK